MKLPLIASILVVFCLPLLGQMDASKIANIEEIFALSKVDQMQQQTLLQMQAMSIAQLEKMPGYAKDSDAFRELQDRLFTMISDRIGFAKIKPAYVTLYDETFSASEIAGMLAFYKSPSGAAMLSKMPTLISKLMTMSQAAMGDIMPEIQQAIKEFEAKSKHAQH